MKPKAIQVLLVDDDPADARLVRESLGHCGASFEVTHVDCLEGAQGLIEARRVDVVVLDLGRSEKRGCETFARARRTIAGIPIVVLAEDDDEASAASLIKRGAQDCLVKGELADRRTARALLCAVERHQAEESLRSSERQFRGLAEAMPQMVWTANPQGVVEYRNPQCIRYTGRSSEQDKGWGWLGILHPEDRQRWRDAWQRSLRTGQALEVEIRIRRASDGSHRWHLGRSVPLRDARGGLARWIGTFTDIDDHMRAAETQARLAAIVESSEDAIYSRGLNGVIQSWNAGAQRLYGYTPGEAIGADFNMLAPPGHRAEQRRLQHLTRRGISVAQLETWRIRKDGRKIEVSLSSWPIRDRNGQIVGASMIVRDIAERKRAERLELERTSLEAVIAAHERVLGVVGHELRTPLAAIRAISELILGNGAGPEALHDYIGNIHRQSVHMAHVVNELLDVARLNSGSARWNWGPVRIDDACASALASIRPLIDPERVKLTLQVDPPDLTVNGDADAIRRLVLNLAHNACKFTSSGSVAVRAALREHDLPPRMDLEVTDTGQGIDPRTAASLGQAFMLNAGMVGEEFVSGSGLGLAICKGIAAAHGGLLTVDSALGRGTTITARLRTDLSGPAPTGQEEIIVRESA